MHIERSSSMGWSRSQKERISWSTSSTMPSVPCNWFVRSLLTLNISPLDPMAGCVRSSGGGKGSKQQKTINRAAMYILGTWFLLLQHQATKAIAATLLQSNAFHSISGYYWIQLHWMRTSSLHVDGIMIDINVTCHNLVCTIAIQSHTKLQFN